MDSAPSPEIDFDQLQRQVRDAVERQRRVRSAKPVVSTGPSLPRLPLQLGPVEDKQDYSLDELLRHHDEDFIRAAFRAVLGRDTDPDLPLWTEKLRTGQRSKIEILGRMRFSAAGKARGVRIPSLLPKFVLHKALRVPVAGPAARVLLETLRLPVHVLRLEQLSTHLERELDRLRKGVNGVVTALERGRTQNLERDIERVFALANERLLEVRQLRERVEQLERGAVPPIPTPEVTPGTEVSSGLAELSRLVAALQDSPVAPARVASPGNWPEKAPSRPQS